MRPHRIPCLIAAAFLICSHDQLPARQTEAVSGTKQQQQDPSIIIVLAEPKTSRPLNWERGKKVTVGVRCVSDKGTRVVGIATDVELAAIRTYPNRVEMMLQADTAAIRKIEAAAKISEFWFEIMPFHADHRRLLAADVPLQDFLKKNPKYRPLPASRWGYGAGGERLAPPTKDQLPIR